MQNTKSNNILYFPIKVSLYFLIFTEILFLLGPIDYNVDNYGYTLLYLFLCNFLMYKGYSRGVHSRIRNADFQTDNVIKIIIIFSSLILLYKLFNLIGSLSPSAIYNKMYESLLSPDEAYKEKLNSGGTSTITYIFMLLSPISAAAIPLGVYNWRKLSAQIKWLIIFLIIGEVLYWIAIGTRKGIFDTIVVVLFMFFAANKQYITVKKNRRKIVLYASFVLGVFVCYFIWSNMSRMGADNINEYAGLFYGIKDGYKLLPSTFTTTLLGLEGYLCQGYYALSKALDEFMLGQVPFTFGFGNNFFTINVIERFNIDVIDFTYLRILSDNYGIDPYVNWHSIYVWLANDLTFIGVPLAMFAIGYIFGQTWVGCLKNNTYAVPAFSLVALMVMYSFANNQILSFSFIAFISWLFLFIRNK